MTLLQGETAEYIIGSAQIIHTWSAFVLLLVSFLFVTFFVRTRRLDIGTDGYDEQNGEKKVGKREDERERN